MQWIGSWNIEKVVQQEAVDKLMSGELSLNPGGFVLVPGFRCTFGVRPCRRQRRCVRLRSDKPFKTLQQETHKSGWFSDTRGI